MTYVYITYPVHSIQARECVRGLLGQATGIDANVPSVTHVPDQPALFELFVAEGDGPAYIVAGEGEVVVVQGRVQTPLRQLQVPALYVQVSGQCLYPGAHQR